MSDRGPNTIPHVADTGPADLDDPASVRGTLRQPFSPVLSQREREDLEGAWTWVDIGIAVALVLIIASAVVSRWVY